MNLPHKTFKNAYFWLIPDDSSLLLRELTQQKRQKVKQIFEI